MKNKNKHLGLIERLKRGLDTGKDIELALSMIRHAEKMILTIEHMKSNGFYPSDKKEMNKAYKKFKTSKAKLDAAVFDRVTQFKLQWPYQFDAEELNNVKSPPPSLVEGDRKGLAVEEWLDAHGFEYERMGWMIGIRDVSAATAIKLTWT